MSRSDFAYAQARLHARLESRLSETDWQMLGGSRNFGNCLDVMNQTAAANVTSRLDRTNTVHDVERVLREEWSAIVFEISNWLPERWRSATQWLVVLPHLRRFEYSPENGGIPGWLRLKMEFGQLSEGMQPGEKAGYSRFEIAKIWRNEWNSSLPDKRYAETLGAELKPLLDRYLGNQTHKMTEAAKTWQELASYLKGLFRKHSQTPVAVFAYLGLIALDFERLRGVLVSRIVFSGPLELEGA
jgi:hypothetical protein